MKQQHRANHLSDGPMDSPWPMKCHDLHHTGRSPVGTADNPYVEIWRYETNARMDTDPAIDKDGVIYVGGDNWDLYAIYPNGTLKWIYETHGLIWNCPAIAEDGTIYIGSWDNHLHAINPDGTLKWKFNTHSNVYSSPAIGDAGTIYFGVQSPGYEIFAVNPNGTEKWRYPTGNVITSDPAIGDDGTIYIGSQDDYLYAIYPNGTLRWRFHTGDVIKGPPSIADDGTIYIASSDDYLYALYPNGTLRWQADIWYGGQTNPSIGEDGTIYVSSSSKLFAIYPNNGTKKWEFNLGGGVYSSSSAICADGIIYTGIEVGDSDGGDIVAVNPDGTERWRKRISNSWSKSSPCISSDGTVYICSSSFHDNEDWGHLHAFGVGEPNNPPDKPTITGQTQGQFGESYNYTFVATDPENRDIWYYIEWDDGETEAWHGPHPSGEEVIISHTWNRRGTYTIRAKVRDAFDAESDWATLKVKMPVNQQYQYPLLELFRQRFPLLYQILFNVLEELNI